MIFPNSKLLVALLPFLLARNVEGNCFTQDNDFIGNPVRDIKDFHIDEIYSPEDCQNQCQNDIDCQFWVWNGPNSNGNKNTCWLKASDAELAVRNGKVSGPKCCSENDCPDNEEESQDSGCLDTDLWNNGRGFDCNSYTQHWCENGAARQGSEWTLGSTFNYPENNCCVCGKEEHGGILEEDQSSEGDVESEDGTIDCSSFFVENTSVGRGRENRAGRVNNVQTAEDCRAECSKVALCQFFNWNTPDAPKNPLACFLKKNDNNPRTNVVGRISGPVSC